MRKLRVLYGIIEHLISASPADCQQLGNQKAAFHHMYDRVVSNDT